MTTNETLRVINAKLAEVLELLGNVQAIHEGHDDQMIIAVSKAEYIRDTLVNLKAEVMSV